MFKKLIKKMVDEKIEKEMAWAETVKNDLLLRHERLDDTLDYFKEKIDIINDQVNSEQFIDDIIERINRKQLKK